MIPYKDEYGDWRCSYCDHWLDREYNFCPDCGECVEWDEDEDE